MKNYKLIILSMGFWGIFLLLSTAHAQTYKWTDEHGNVGLTDDLSTVPENIRRLQFPPAHQKSEWRSFDEYGLRGGQKVSHASE